MNSCNKTDGCTSHIKTIKHEESLHFGTVEDFYSFCMVFFAAAQKKGNKKKAKIHYIEKPKNSKIIKIEHNSFLQNG